MAQVLTYSRMMKAGACRDQLNAFDALFGTEVAITEDVCAQYYDRFDWDCAALKLLPPKEWVKFRQETRDLRLAFNHAPDMELWTKYQKVAAVAFARLYA